MFSKNQNLPSLNNPHELTTFPPGLCPAGFFRCMVQGKVVQ